MWTVLKGLGVAAAALTAAVLVTLAAARLTPSPPVFLLVGWGAAVAVWLVGCRWLRPRSWLVPVSGALAITAVLGTGLIPLGDPARSPATPPGAGRWPLPDGGWLAYGVVRAAGGRSTAGAPAPAPVVVLHGGPGVPDTAGFLTALGPLAAGGRDVWAYDQRGSGASSRLADPRGYHTAQAVADLEQVRQHIGAPRLILVGHSYGAFLAASYIAAHPGRVERVILSSPGDLDEAGLGGSPQSRLDTSRRLRLYGLLASPRALLTYALVQVNPAAAHALAGDGEVDARQDRVYAATVPALHCRGHSGPALHGLGFYANQVPQSDPAPPPPEVLRALRAANVPALVLKGQCDYLDWRSATRYLDVFPTALYAYLPDAGHETYMDRPDLFLAAVSSFVAGRPVPGRLADPQRPPDDYQP
jgi:proline iminopeptidase